MLPPFAKFSIVSYLNLASPSPSSFPSSACLLPSPSTELARRALINAPANNVFFFFFFSLPLQGEKTHHLQQPHPTPLVTLDRADLCGIKNTSRSYAELLRQALSLPRLPSSPAFSKKRSLFPREKGDIAGERLVFFFNRFEERTNCCNFHRRMKVKRDFRFVEQFVATLKNRLDRLNLVELNLLFGVLLAIGRLLSSHEGKRISSVEMASDIPHN